MAQRKKKQRYILYGVFLAAVLAVLFLGQKIPRDNALSKQVADASAPVFNVMRKPVLWYHHLSDEISHYLFVAQANKKLRKENASFQGWRHEAIFLRREVQELRALLQMAEERTTDPVAARVLADTRSPYARTVLIDAGANKGVEKGQAVLSPEGLAGRVLEVSERTARILLLGDHNARIPVKLLDSGMLAIAKGGRYRALDLVLSDGPLKAEDGELVVTSGIGGVFASGIPVGVVVQAQGAVKVQPHTEFSALDKVIVHRRPVYGIVDESAFQLEVR